MIILDINNNYFIKILWKYIQILDTILILHGKHESNRHKFHNKATSLIEEAVLLLLPWTAIIDVMAFWQFDKIREPMTAEKNCQ